MTLQTVAGMRVHGPCYRPRDRRPRTWAPRGEGGGGREGRGGEGGGGERGGRGEFMVFFVFALPPLSCTRASLSV